MGIVIIIQCICPACPSPYTKTEICRVNEDPQRASDIGRLINNYKTQRKTSFVARRKFQFLFDELEDCYFLHCVSHTKQHLEYWRKRQQNGETGHAQHRCGIREIRRVSKYCSTKRTCVSCAAIAHKHDNAMHTLYFEVQYIRDKQMTNRLASESGVAVSQYMCTHSEEIKKHWVHEW